MEFIKKHKLFSHPIIGAFILMVYGTFFYQGFGILFSIIIGKTFGNTSEIFMQIGAGIGGILLLVIHKLWFKDEYRGSFYFENFFEKSIVIVVAVDLIIDTFINILGIYRLGFAVPSITSFTIPFMAAIGEEAVFRVLAVSVIMRYYKDQDTYLPALFIPAIVFGLIHLSNIGAGASVSATIGQTITTLVAGLFFAALYIRTGSISWPIIVHFGHDFLCSLIATQANGINVVGISLADIFENGLLVIVQIILIIFLLKGHKDEIINTWKQVWYIKKDSLN